MGIPERITAAKRRDRLTDEGVGSILGVKGATAQRYRTGKIVLPRDKYQAAADWFGDVDAETVRAEAETQADTGETSPGQETLQEAAQSLSALGKEMARHLTQAQRLVRQLQALRDTAQSSS